MSRTAMSLAALAVACLAPSARAEFPRGRPAPPFTLRKLDGGAASLASFRGKVVLLDFWGPT